MIWVDTCINNQERKKERKKEIRNAIRKKDMKGGGKKSKKKQATLESKVKKNCCISNPYLNDEYFVININLFISEINMSESD